MKNPPPSMYENFVSILSATSDLSKKSPGVYQHNITGQEFDLLHERAYYSDREVLIALVQFIEDNSRRVGHAEGVAACQNAISNL